MTNRVCRLVSDQSAVSSGKGGNGADTLYSAGGHDTVLGGNGNDLIIGGSGAGNDTYKGESGADIVKYTSAEAGIVTDLSQATENPLGREMHPALAVTCCPVSKVSSEENSAIS